MKKRDIGIEEMPQGCVLTHDNGKTIIVSSFDDADAIIESLQRMKSIQQELRTVQPIRKVVYIASPYTKGDVAVNVRESFLVADELVRLGYLPFPPLFSHFWHFLSPHPYEFWTELDMEWLLHVDYILRLTGESSGADREVLFAESYGIPVYYSISDLP